MPPEKRQIAIPEIYSILSGQWAILAQYDLVYLLECLEMLTSSLKVAANCGFFQYVSWAAGVKIHVMDLRQKTFVWLTLKSKGVNFASVYPGTVFSIMHPKIRRHYSIIFSTLFHFCSSRYLFHPVAHMTQTAHTEKSDYYYMYLYLFNTVRTSYNCYSTLTQANSETSACVGLYKK